MNKSAPSMERAISVDIGCQPSFSDSGEIVIQTDSSTLIVFHAISSQLSDDGCYHNLDYALVECVRCNLSRFGYPNDEGLPEHLLYDHGLSDASGIAEVINSSWAEALATQMDTSARRIWGDHYNKAYEVPLGGQRHFDWRHFIFTFKENTFECIAHDLKVLFINKPFDEIMVKVTKRISGE